MSNQNPSIHHSDPWQVLNRFTSARIALGRAGMSLTTKAHLEFQLAHARARDSVNEPLDFKELARQLRSDDIETLSLNSRAPDRPTYLQRPDKGRLLDRPSEEKLSAAAGNIAPADIVFVIVDGLSSMAIERHARRFIRQALRKLRAIEYAIAPVCLVRQGRVAIGDHIGQILSAKMSVVLIGERPGLSSPDSMGIYFTWSPRLGLTDADRNCISNIHAKGLSYDIALQKLTFLITEAGRLKLSGVRLKEDTQLEKTLEKSGQSKNFLTGQQRQSGQ
jgi:ethanolamine ammonia-lyase small subunit